MKKWILTILLLMLGTMNFAAARKPAVEDFIGVEPEGVDFRSPASSTETFRPFNFSQNNASMPTNQNSNFALWVLFAMVASLPLMSWFILSKKSETGEVAAENIRHLKDYRQ